MSIPLFDPKKYVCMWPRHPCYERKSFLLFLVYTSITREQANKFFVLISELYEHSSVIFTTNKDITQWAELFGDPVLTQALLDRILHHAKCFSLEGD